ncbi:class I SAM-dependent methyltransferase [Kribbella sp. NPDC056345]|uniref:class I SAM-dependent methyltransferase n=1 Tax=Kribbella sp. NPDC056345 TaxID=3345789 RepID=UPI0035E2ECF2
MRYYEVEPRVVYGRVVREGLTQWNEVFEGGDRFADFPNRGFLEGVVPGLPVGGAVLEYGCGTGPAACFLAGLGFRVDAVDVSPVAIALAKGFAEERGVRVNFGVQDVCRWPEVETRYDVVLDSYCLQNIVLDEDRAAVFRGVRDRLLPDGRYLISTALYDVDRVYGEELRYDAVTGICYRGELPYRRHLTPSALRAELEGAGFAVLSFSGTNLVCARA